MVVLYVDVGVGTGEGSPGKAERGSRGRNELTSEEKMLQGEEGDYG